MNLDKISDRLFVGSCLVTGDDVDWLKLNFGITAVLSLQTDEDFNYWKINWKRLENHYRKSDVEIRRVPVTDFDPNALRLRLPAAVDALGELMAAGHTVYVHCSAGINRAPTTAIAYLHWVEGQSLEEAHQHVTKCRACDPYIEAIKLATQDRAGE